MTIQRQNEMNCCFAKQMASCSRAQVPGGLRIPARQRQNYLAEDARTVRHSPTAFAPGGELPVHGSTAGPVLGAGTGFGGAVRSTAGAVTGGAARGAATGAGIQVVSFAGSITGTTGMLTFGISTGGIGDGVLGDCGGVFAGGIAGGLDAGDGAIVAGPEAKPCGAAAPQPYQRQFGAAMVPTGRVDHGCGDVGADGVGVGETANGA
jgi:hypothetical protein